MDRISDLPTHVIEKILGSLPMADAARTSVLSTKWRHKWEEAPQLVFDNTFVIDLQRRRGSMSDALLMLTIYEVLLLHSGSVNKFTLSIPQLQSCPEIDRVILFLSKKGVQDFKLSMLSADFHKLPSHMFSYVHLRTLKLYSCIVDSPSTFKGFSKLVSLEFQKVYHDADFFDTFISKCPQLERLVLNSCISEEPCRIEINAPNLKSFNYTGAYASICFKNAPLLAEATIYNCTGEYPRNDKAKMSHLDEVLIGLSAIESLSVDYYFLKIIAVRDASRRVPIILNHLKVLEVFDLGLADEKDVSCLLGLIKSSPNLEELMIEMNPDPSTNSSLQLASARDYSALSLNKLQKVNFHGFKGTATERELIKFLLSKLPALKTMLIQAPAGMDDREQIKLLKKMIRFQRASPTAEILYGD